MGSQASYNTGWVVVAIFTFTGCLSEKNAIYLKQKGWHKNVSLREKKSLRKETKKFFRDVKMKEPILEKQRLRKEERKWRRENV